MMLSRAVRPSLIGVASCVLLVSGCMGNLDEVLARHEMERQTLAAQTAERVASARPCCTSYREMTFQPLRVGVAHEIVLTESSPTIDFSFGRSRFEAFELPSLDVGDALEIKAVELISGPTAKPIFRPVLVLLSDKFEPVEEQPSLDFKDSFTGWDFEGHAARVVINATYAHAKYAIVAADPAFSGKSYLRRAHTNVVPAGTTYVSTSSPDQHFPYGYEGRSFIEVEQHAH